MRTADDKMQEHRVVLSCCEAEHGVAEISMRRGSPALATWAEVQRRDLLYTEGGNLIEAFFPPAICAMLGRHTSRMYIYSRFLSLLENTRLFLPAHSHGKHNSQPRP